MSCKRKVHCKAKYNSTTTREAACRLNTITTSFGVYGFDKCLTLLRAHFSYLTTILECRNGSAPQRSASRHMLLDCLSISPSVCVWHLWVMPKRIAIIYYTSTTVFYSLRESNTWCWALHLRSLLRIIPHSPFRRSKKLWATLNS